MTIYTPTTQPSSNGKYPRKHIALAAAVGIIIGFALSIAPKSDASAKRVIIDLPTPVISSISENTSNSNDTSVLVDAAAPEQKESVAQRVTTQSETASAPSKAGPSIYEVKRGDSLSQIFQRAGLSSAEMEQILSNRQAAKALSRLKPGQRFEVETSPAGALESLRLAVSLTDTLVVSRKSDSAFNIDWDKKEPKPFTTYTQGEIRSSLFLAGKEAGLNTLMTMELAKIFGWDIDFALDIRKGDTFRVIYEEMFVDGQKVRDGKILAAEFVNQGKKYSAVRYERKDGSFDYYSAEGNTLKKAFLRTPIDFARISSHFSLARMHPVLHTLRAHKGTDYAARHGTPIKATGDGSVKLAGRKGGYGNVVIIDHGRGYQSLYAHMQKFGSGIRNGSRVRQGQIIGYVGSSGLASGPHLHYEFHINGQVRNPVTVALPETLPIAGPERVAFNNQAKGILKQLETFAGAYEGSQLALAQEQ